MANERHKTTLEIGVDDRLLRRFGAQIGRIFSTEPIERHQRAQEKVTKELENQRRAAEELSRVRQQPEGATRDSRGRLRDSRGKFIGGGSGGGRPGGGGSGGARGGSGGSGGGGSQEGGRQPMGFFGTAGATGAGVMGAQMMQRGGSALAGIGRGTGATAQALGAIPFVGPALSATLQAAEGLADVAMGVGQATAQAAGQTGLGRVGGMGLARLGISRQELPGRLAALSQQSGLRGEGLRELAPQAIEMEARTGIQAGSMIGAAGTSADDAVSASQGMSLTKSVIESGIVAGFREARLGRMVQSMATNIEQMRSKGIMVDPRTATDVLRMLGSTRRKGLTGEAGLHAAETIKDTLRQSSDRNDFYGAMSMQVAMDQGLSHFEASRQLEESPEKFLPEIMNRVGEMGGSDEAKAMMLRQWMPQLSRTQALNVAQAANTGEIDDAANQLAQSKNVNDRADQFLQKQKEMTEGAFGVAAQAAGLTNLQAGKGEGVVGDVMTIRKREAQMAGRGAKMGAAAGDLMSGMLDKYSSAVTSDNPIGAVFDLIAQDMSSLFSTLSEKISTAVDEAFNPGGAVQQASDFLGVTDYQKDFFGQLEKDFKAFLNMIVEAFKSLLPDSLGDMLKPISNAIHVAPSLTSGI